MEELVGKIILWIKDKVVAAGKKGVVLGMSGGVDSSVTAVLCQRAFPEATLGVIMPCYSDKLDEMHAQLVANKFGIPVTKIVLDEVFDTLLKVLPTPPASSKQLAEANLKPRLRMTVLYYLANCLDYLVVGSSNRSELSIGYFTKYGDGGVDLIPLGNLTKSEVRELAIYLGIPQEIIDKPPSAGLWAGQTDEGELGLTYAQLDHYLRTGEGEEAIKKRINFLITKNAHKLSPPPSPFW